MTWLTMLKLVPWRYVAYGAGVLALIALGWRVSVWRDSHVRALPEALQAVELERSCLAPSECQRRVAALSVRQDQISNEVIRGFQDEIDALRNRPVPTRVIRVCRSGSQGGVPVPAGPGGTPAVAGSGLVHGADEFDTGPLRDLARQADEVSAAYRALRARDEALATPTPID